MSTAPRRPLAVMRAYAEQLVQELKPYCARIEVAGSIRRQRPAVADIELVAVPYVEEHPAGLVGDEWETVNLLDDYLHLRLGTQPGPQWRCWFTSSRQRRFGGRYKALLWQADAASAPVPVDLFSVVPGTDAQWGLIYLIRTGPAEFGHRLVTSTRQGGWLPDYLQAKGGAIRHRATGEIVPTPEERDVFRVLGRDYLPPEERTA